MYITGDEFHSYFMLFDSKTKGEVAHDIALKLMPNETNWYKTNYRFMREFALSNPDYFVIKEIKD